MLPKYTSVNKSTRQGDDDRDMHRTRYLATETWIDDDFQDLERSGERHLP